MITYPWEEWFDKSRFGQQQELKAGEHYAVQHYVMASMLRNTATKKGLRVSVHILSDGLIFTVRKPVFPRGTKKTTSKPTKGK